MNKIAAVGDFEKTAYFRVLGARIFCPKSEGEAVTILDRLKKEEYALIFLDGRYSGLLKRYNGGEFPLIFLTGDEEQ